MRIVTAILAFYIIALLLPQMAVAQVYSYIDKDGVMVFTSKKPDATRYEVKDHGCFGVCRTGVNWANTPLKPQAYAQEVKHAVDAFGVDEALVRAIMHAESWFEVDALSSAGAQGLMQLMPATQKRFGVSDPYNSMQNISAGVQYLAWLMNEFNHDTNYVVAAYNAGENAVKRHQGVPPFSETQEYLRRVNILYKRYRDVL